MSNQLPTLVSTLPYWQKVTARLVHLSFYALMFALPVSGLLMSSAAAIPVSAFGMFDLPNLVAPSEALFRRLIHVHRWLGYALLLLIGLHAGAALMHHFVKRDNTLKKMLSPKARPLVDHVVEHELGDFPQRPARRAVCSRNARLGRPLRHRLA